MLTSSFRKLSRTPTALPPTNKASSKEVSPLFGTQTGNGVRCEEVVELRDQLEKIAEGKEAAIQSPRRTLHGSCPVGLEIAIATKQNPTLTNGFLSGERLRVNVLDCGVRDAVQETKARNNKSILASELG